MSNVSRRKLFATAAGVAVGATGLDLAGCIGRRYGLIPPDSGGVFGIGQTLTYAAQRMLTHGSFAREFPPDRISKMPFANGVAPLGAQFAQLERGGFAGWRLVVDGMVSRPCSFSLAELGSFPRRSQITHLACEEGWSYIAEWTGVPLAHILELAGASPHAQYVVYQSIQPDWWDSIDMADATHPQTLVTYGMNGGRLPVPFGGPIRMRVPRQLAYKSVKYINHLILTNDVRKFGDGLGSSEPASGYSWYAGI